MMCHRVGIIGGGLAGLSSAFHLLKKSPSVDITIIDSNLPGMGGASAVAGGLLHPLNPRGKLAYKGLEGLASANELIRAASQFENNVVLRNKIYRTAMTEKQATEFKQTAAELPNMATWVEPTVSVAGNKKDWEERYFCSEPNVLGALRLSGESKVIHMCSYLNGLWSYCQSLGTGTKIWITRKVTDTGNNYEWKEQLQDFDCVIFAAGAGLFKSSLVAQNEFPIQLVRGQSIEMTTTDDQCAILCGKYVSPLLEKGRVLIGATHEYGQEPLKPNEVEDELRKRSYQFASRVWDTGSIKQVTKGYRVQSNRGRYGRLPIVGKLENYYHPNSWIFTGLSGRGLLYHGLFGDLLTDSILEIENEDSDLLENMNWWL